MYDVGDARLQGGHCRLAVQGIRRGHSDYVQALVAQHLAEIGVRLGAEPSADLLGHFLADVSYGDELHVRVIVQCLGVLAAQDA